MALIKLGALITAISGKVGGQSFATGRGGSYIKNIGSYTVRKNPLTSAKLNNFSYLAGQYRLLTQIQRDGWSAEALNHPYQNRLNETKFYSGYILFIKFNGNLIEAGLPLVQDAPTAVTFVPQFGWDVVYSAPDFFLQCPASTPNTVYILQMSGAVNPSVGPDSVNYVRVLKDETPAGGANDNINTGLLARYGFIESGARYYYRLGLVNNVTGQKLLNVIVGHIDIL